jgi:hypothetical protein
MRLVQSAAVYALLTSMAAPLPVLAQKLELGQIGYGLDGEAWHSLDTSTLHTVGKYTYLRGVYDGVMFSRSPDMGAYPTGMSWNLLIDALDRFYAEPANRQVYVVWALRVVRLQMGGAQPDVTDSAIRKYRCRATAIHAYQSAKPEDSSKQYGACGPDP